jgi:hypothetical protein
MEKMGPSIELLLRRIAETPDYFLTELKNDGSPISQAIILIIELYLKFGLEVSSSVIHELETNLSSANHRALAMICVWLLNDESLSDIKIDEPQVKNLLIQSLGTLAHLSSPQKFISDLERREEFVRLVLGRLNYRPKGETVNQAMDRLSSLSIVERKRLIKESQEAEKRARAIREALAKKAAEDSADKWTRE